MTIEEHIGNFLRDAQYRIAQLSISMDDMQDQAGIQYRTLYSKRLQLSAFMDVLFEGHYPIIDDGFNHIQYVDEQTSATIKTTWTERELLSEIEYLRYITQMNEVPYITFTGHYPLIQEMSSSGSGGSGSGAALPLGTYLQMIVYNVANVPVAVDIDPYAGPLDGESINAYFSGRP